MRYWAGSDAPSPDYVKSQLLIRSSQNYRESPFLHGRFSQVNLLGIDLAHYHSWPFLLDEAFRLGNSLVNSEVDFRFTESPHIDIEKVSEYLEHLPEFEVAVVSNYENVSMQGDEEVKECFVKLSVCRKYPAAPSRSIAFMVIPEDDEFEGLDVFVKALKNLRALESFNWKIYAPDFLKISTLCDFADGNIVDVVFSRDANESAILFDDYLRGMTEACSEENLLICRPNRSLEPDFLLALLAHGMDFGALVPRSEFPDGARGQDWVVFDDTKTATALVPYATAASNAFAFLGVLLVKTVLLRDALDSWSNMQIPRDELGLSISLRSAGLALRPIPGAIVRSNIESVTSLIKLWPLDRPVTLPAMELSWQAVRGSRLDDEATSDRPVFLDELASIGLILLDEEWIDIDGVGICCTVDSPTVEFRHFAGAVQGRLYLNTTPMLQLPTKSRIPGPLNVQLMKSESRSSHFLNIMLAAGQTSVTFNLLSARGIVLTELVVVHI